MHRSMRGFQTDDVLKNRAGSDDVSWCVRLVKGWNRKDKLLSIQEPPHFSCINAAFSHYNGKETKGYQVESIQADIKPRRRRQTRDGICSGGISPYVYVYAK